MSKVAVLSNCTCHGFTHLFQILIPEDDKKFYFKQRLGWQWLIMSVIYYVATLLGWYAHSGASQPYPTAPKPNIFSLWDSLNTSKSLGRKPIKIEGKLVDNNTFHILIIDKISRPFYLYQQLLENDKKFFVFFWKMIIYNWDFDEGI